MRVSQQFLRTVDDWRRGQTDIPSRAEAIGGEARPGSQKPFQLPVLAQVLDAPQRGDHLLADFRAFTAAFHDLEIGTTAGGLLAKVHGRLIPCQHMISSYAIFIKRFTTKRGTTFLRKPTLASCNINDLEPIPAPQLLKIAKAHYQLILPGNQIAA
jgi:hypothetical protein